MSRTQSAVTSFGLDIDTTAPLWARVDAEADGTDTPEVIREIACGQPVPEIASDYNAFVVGFGTGTSLHAPDIVPSESDHETDGLTRRCNEGHGDAAKPRDFQRMVDWRKECSHEECQQYFDALEAAGVIDR